MQNACTSWLFFFYIYKSDYNLRVTAPGLVQYASFFIGQKNNAFNETIILCVSLYLKQFINKILIFWNNRLVGTAFFL